LKNEDKLIIGIDASTTSTGVVILDYECNIEYCTHTNREVKKDKTWQNKNMHTIDEIEYVFNNYKNAYVFIEGVPYSNRPGSDQLHELSGIIKKLYWDHHKNLLGMYAVLPSVWMAQITGSGKSDKKANKEVLEQLFDYSFLTTDESDAAGVALFGHKFIFKDGYDKIQVNTKDKKTKQNKVLDQIVTKVF
jgi:Holliday junction resolvasome RuvABC endonuclease subunit